MLLKFCPMPEIIAPKKYCCLFVLGERWTRQIVWEETQTLSVLCLWGGGCSHFCTLLVPHLGKNSKISKLFKYQMLLLNLKWLYERLLSAHLLYRWLYFYLVSPQSRNNKNTTLQFLLCALRVPLKCSSVSYPAIVPCNPSRSELLTTSEWLHVLWPLTSSLGYHFWCFFQYFFQLFFFFFYFFSCHSDFFFQSYGSRFWAVSPGQTYLPLLSYLMCNLLALTIPFILKNIALEKSVLKPSSSSDCFCL